MDNNFINNKACFPRKINVMQESCVPSCLNQEHFILIAIVKVYTSIPVVHVLSNSLLKWALILENGDTGTYRGRKCM